MQLSLERNESGNILAHILRNTTVFHDRNEKFLKIINKTGDKMKFWKTILAAAEDESAFSTALQGITRKLGRGVTNVAFGALELPLKMYEVNFEEGGFAACTYGVFYGLCFVVEREIVGVVDIATFLVPLPGCRQDPNEAGWGYGPIMRPEWIITPDKNYYNFVYPSSATMN